MTDIIEMRVTLKDMLNELKSLEKRGFPMEAVVLWADEVNPGSKYELKHGAVAGSVVMGITFVKDGERDSGVLTFAPSKISNVLN